MGTAVYPGIVPGYNFDAFVLFCLAFFYCVVYNKNVPTIPVEPGTSSYIYLIIYLIIDSWSIKNIPGRLHRKPVPLCRKSDLIRDLLDGDRAEAYAAYQNMRGGAFSMKEK